MQHETFMQEVYGKERVVISASLLQVRLLEIQKGLGLALRKLIALCCERCRLHHTARGDASSPEESILVLPRSCC